MKPIENPNPSSPLAATAFLPNPWQLGMLIPFNREFFEKSRLEAICNSCLEHAEEKITKLLDKSQADNLISRLYQLTRQLDFTIPAKSLFISINGKKDKFVPLNIKTRPAISISKKTDLLDLAGHFLSDPHFFLINRDETGETIYEYHGNRFDCLYGTEIPGPPNEAHCKLLSSILDKYNPEADLPVFITGNRGGQLTPVCKHRVFIEHASGFSPFSLPQRAALIASNWNYWRKKMIEGKLKLNGDSGRLVAGTDSVMQTLGLQVNGTVLIDTSVIDLTNEAFSTVSLDSNPENPAALLENFLSRGNQLQCISHPMLKALGGIVFIYNKNCEPVQNEA